MRHAITWSIAAYRAGRSDRAPKQRLTQPEPAVEEPVEEQLESEESVSAPGGTATGPQLPIPPEFRVSLAKIGGTSTGVKGGAVPGPALAARPRRSPPTTHPDEQAHK